MAEQLLTGQKTADKEWSASRFQLVHVITIHDINVAAIKDRLCHKHNFKMATIDRVSPFTTKQSATKRLQFIVLKKYST